MFSSCSCSCSLPVLVGVPGGCCSCAVPDSVLLSGLAGAASATAGSIGFLPASILDKYF